MFGWCPSFTGTPPLAQPGLSFCTLHWQEVLGWSGVCGTISSSPICFWLQQHASAACQPCQNLTAIHTHQLWFLLLLLTVLRSPHLFRNKRGPCIFTQGWGWGAAEEERCWTGVCFTSVYPHFSLVRIPPSPDACTECLRIVLAMASSPKMHFSNYAI